MSSSSAPADPITIATAGPGDLDALLPLMRDFYAGERLPFDEGALRGALGALWADPPNGAVFVALGGGAVVGYAVLCFGFSLEYAGRDAFVDELFVVSDRRDAGIGGRLLAALEDACRAAGAHALHLEVDHGNARGKRLYVRSGFADHDRHLMTKWLGPRPGADPAADQTWRNTSST